MAQKVHVVLEDDIDGGSADETVAFSLDGTSYEIDLSSTHAAELRRALAPWIQAGRRVTSSKSARGRRGSDVAKIRAWAKSRGMQVSERGRISQQLRDQYNAAH